MAPVHEINTYSVASSASSSSSTSSAMGYNSCWRKGSSEHWNTSVPLASTEMSFDDAFFENAIERFHQEFKSSLADWDDAEDINDTWFERETSLSKRLRPETESSSYRKITDNKFTAVVRENGDYEVMMNICELKLKDVKVRIAGEKYVVVEGSKEEGNTLRNCRQSQRNFLYQFSLPNNVTLDAVSATLSSDGILTITMPSEANTERQSDICGMESHRAKRHIIDNINDNIGQKCKVIDIQKTHTSVRTKENCSAFSCQSSLESATGKDQRELQTLANLKDCSRSGTSRQEVSLEKEKEYLKRDCSFTTTSNKSKADLSQSSLRENRHVKGTIIPINKEELKDQHLTNSSEREIKVSNDSTGTKKVSFYDEDSLYQQRYTNGYGESRRMEEPITNFTGSQHETLTYKPFLNNEDIEQRTESSFGHRNNDLDLTIKTQTVCCDAKCNELLPNPSTITRSTHLNNSECIEQQVQSVVKNSALIGKQCLVSEYMRKETEENTYSNAESSAIETSCQSPEKQIKPFPQDEMTKSPISQSPVQLEVVEKGRFLEESSFLSMRQSLTTALEGILSKNSRLLVHDDLVTCYRRYQEDNAMECDVLSLTQVEHSSLKFIVDVFGLMEQSINVSIMNGKEIRIGGQHSHTKGEHQSTKDFSKTFLLQEGSSIESASASISSDGFLMITINKKNFPESIDNEPRNEKMIQEEETKEDSKHKDKVNTIQDVNGLPQESKRQMVLGLSDDDQESAFGVMSAGSRNGWTSATSLAFSEDRSTDVKRKSGAQAEMFPTASLSSGESEVWLTDSADKLNSVGMEESQTNTYEEFNETLQEKESEANRDKCNTNSNDNLYSFCKDESEANTDVGFTDSKDRFDYVSSEESKANDNLDSVWKEESVANRDVGSIKDVIEEESKANTDIVFINSKDKLDLAWKEESKTNGDVEFIGAAQEGDSEAEKDVGFTNSKDKISSLWKEELEANRQVVFIEAVQEEKSKDKVDIRLPDSKDNLGSVWNEESQANRDVEFTEAVPQEESETNTHIGFTNSKDKLHTASKEELEDNRDVVFTKAVIQEESEATRDVSLIDSKNNHYKLCNKDREANAYLGLIEDKLHTVRKEESDATTNQRLINSKDKFYDVCMGKSEAGTDVGFNEDKLYSAHKEVSAAYRTSLEKELSNHIQREISTAQQTEYGYFYPDTQNNEILANVSIEEVSEDLDTDISQTSSLSFKKLKNLQGLKTSTFTDQTKEFLSNDKCTSLTVIKMVSFDTDTFYETARLHCHKKETDPSQKGTFTSINGDANDKTIICILDDQEENEIVSSFEDEYQYTMIVDVSSYLNKEIEVEVLNDGKVLVKCFSMINNDSELDHNKVFSRTFDIPTGLEIESGICGVSLDGVLAVTFNKKVSLDALQVKSSGEVGFTDNSEKDRESSNVEERAKLTREEASNTVDFTGRKLTLSDQGEELNCSTDTQALTDQIITTGNGLTEEQKSSSKDQNRFMEESSFSDDAHKHYEMGGGSELAQDSPIQSAMESGRIQQRGDSSEENTKGETASEVSLNLQHKMDNPVDALCVDSQTASGDSLRTFKELLSSDHNTECSSDSIKKKGHLSIMLAKELDKDEKLLMAKNIVSTQVINDDFSHLTSNIDSLEGKESVNISSSDDRKHETHDDSLDSCTDNDAIEKTNIMKQKTGVISSLENGTSLESCENRSESKPVLPAVQNDTIEVSCSDNCISIQVEEKRLFGDDAFFDRARPHFVGLVKNLSSKVGQLSSENQANADYKNLCPTEKCNEERISTFAEDEQYYMIILDVGIYTKKTQIDIKVREEKEVLIEWASLTNEEGEYLEPYSKRFDLPCGIDVESAFSGISSDGILIITFPKMNQSYGVGRSLSHEDVSKGSTFTQTLTTDTNLTQSEGFIITPEGGRNCRRISDVARWEELNQETSTYNIATITSASQSSFANVRCLPFTKRGLFFKDSFFHEVHPLFQTAMKNVLMSSTDDQNCKNATDLNTYHCLTEHNPNLENQAFQAQEDQHSYKVVLDVANLSEESMVVYVVDKKELVVEGQVQKTHTSSSSLQSFKRDFSLPQTTEFIEATATLSSDGVLFVEFSKRIGVQRDWQQADLQSFLD